MNHRISLIATLCAAATLALTACGDASTDAPMPDGKAPNLALEDKKGSDPILKANKKGSDPIMPQDQADPSGLPVANPDKPVAQDPPGVPIGRAQETVEETETIDPVNDPSVLVVRPVSPVLVPHAVAGDKAERIEAGGMSCALPKGWSNGPEKQMRVLTLLPPKAQEGAEMAIAKWPGDVGGFRANVARWARQVGIKQDAIERKDYPQIDVGGTKSAWIELINKEDDKAILALWVPRGEDPDKPTQTWTIKLVGTAKQIEALKPAVKAWAASVKFEEE